MRIWWQDPTPKQPWMDKYHGWIKEAAGLVCEADNVVDIYSLQEGYPSPTPSYPHLYNSLQIVKSIRRAEEQGYDAVVLGCMLQGGLKEARSIVDIPVVGAFESAAWLAATLGQKFSVLVTDRSVKHVAEELVEQYGLERRVASIRCLEGGTFKMMMNETESYIQVVSTAIKRFSEEDGAEAVIPFCTITGALLASRKLLNSFGIPIAEPVCASLKMAEAMSKLSKSFNLSVCRKSVYMKPPKSFLDKIPL
ncbi:MAG: aspartate/glutamate racemase family protein [Nitrososphaerales archaeon]